MKDLRNLLLDCRAALRRVDPQFENTPLGERLDETIIGMVTGAEPAREVLAAPTTPAAQQVAYAWQQAARELHFTHPELYAELGRDVRERLQRGTLVDPNTELLQLQRRLRDGDAAAQGARAAQVTELASARAALAALCEALAAAVALDGADALGSEVELAQRRIAGLLAAARTGTGLAKPRAPSTDEVAPTPAELQQVSRGERTFSAVEREWCIGEAMVRSHFERSPAQLLADGDDALARLLLAPVGAHG
jgi:hypothetical protein